MSPEAVIEAIKDLLGPKGYLDSPADMAPYLIEARERWPGLAPLVARPRSTEEVSRIMAICNESRIGVVPQGGNTGLSGGAMPDMSGKQIVLSLSRLNKIRALDALELTLTAEAGCILADVQAAAKEQDCLFPLSLAAEGSCQIGGNIATNAGGINVLQYGTARNLVLGLEVVLPDGRIWNGLRALHKDNTGYDLKQLFIGAEGTLGVVTAAVCKLFPLPKQKATAFAALRQLEDCVPLLRAARAATGDRVTSFELIPRMGLDFVLRHMPGCTDPLSQPAEWYVLIELGSPDSDENLGAKLETFLARALEDAQITDAVVAASEAQAQSLWRLREHLSESQKFEGGSIKHDIAVPVGKIPAFIRGATAAVEKAVPGIRPVPFGHAGDGNIHFNLSQPEGGDTDTFLARRAEINGIVHDVLSGYAGSISAEHGVGQHLTHELTRHKSAVEMDLMRTLKAALDPNGIMNPGKVVVL